MHFLRLGVACAVIDDEGRVLLSRRGDLNVWNLPGGRLDSGELLQDAAAREVREETGIIAQIDRPVGLYFWANWSRLNVLYTGWPLGGDLQQRTFETRANQYFAPEDVPHMPWSIMALDALAGTRHKPRILETPPHEFRKIRAKLVWRYVYNYLREKPEPRFPRFKIRAVGIIWDETHRRLLTTTQGRHQGLPVIHCDGRESPWDQLRESVYKRYDVEASFRWVGLWQDAGRNAIDFVFAATIEENELPDNAEWTGVRNLALSGKDAEFAERVKPTYANDAVWTIIHQGELQTGETLNLGAKRHDAG